MSTSSDLDVGMWILPTDDTNATISTPYASLRYFSAIAPAATRPAWSEPRQLFSCESIYRRAHQWSREHCSVLHHYSP